MCGRTAVTRALTMSQAPACVADQAMVAGPALAREPQCQQQEWTPQGTVGWKLVGLPASKMLRSLIAKPLANCHFQPIESSV